MSSVLGIEKALSRLPREERWEVLRWLLEDLQERASAGVEKRRDDTLGEALPALPDYAARRRRIFGAKVLPNMVLAARYDEPW